MNLVEKIISRLQVRLGSKADLQWAQETVTRYHYLHQPVNNRARPMVYIVEMTGGSLGLVMAGIPHATKCAGWWGYPGLPSQWQVVDLCRIWLAPEIQHGGALARPGLVPGFVDRKGIFRPTVASWVIEQVLSRIQQDWVSLWPPIYLDRPYHIRLVISYHDPQYHRGSIYRQTNAIPMYTDSDGNPIPGESSGKFGWCYPLPVPVWEWQDIQIQKPRTIKMF